MYQDEIRILKALEIEFKQRYQTFVKVAEGQFGRVYKARVLQSTERVAIKVVDKSALAFGILEYMQEEVRILRAVQDNENIIKLKAYVENEDYIYIVQEFCPLTLDRLFTEYFNREIPENITISILRQIANGLSGIHRHKVIHRDLKPENVMIQISEDTLKKLKTNKQLINQGVFKIIDFGLSKQLMNEDLTTTFAGSELYTVPNLLAPEVLNEVPYGYQADMYSLGVLMYELATGRLPYRSVTLQPTQVDLIKAQEASFSEFKDESLRLIVQKMLRYDPKDRMNWSELYQHPYFNFEQNHLIGMLDLQLLQNRSIYTQQFQDEVDFQHPEEQKIQQNLQDMQDVQMNFYAQQSPVNFYTQQSPMNQDEVFNTTPDLDTITNQQVIKMILAMRNQYLLIMRVYSALDDMKQSILSKEYHFSQGQYQIYSHYLVEVSQELYYELFTFIKNNQDQLKNDETFELLMKNVQQDLKRLGLTSEVKPSRRTSFFGHIAEAFQNSIMNKLKGEIQIEQVGTQKFKAQFIEVTVKLFKWLNLIHSHVQNDIKSIQQANQELNLIYSAMIHVLSAIPIFHETYIEDHVVDHKTNEMNYEDEQNQNMNEINRRAELLITNYHIDLN